MRLYFDVCCLSRPFDDQRQQRIRLETEAVLALLDLCAQGLHEWVAGEAIEEEVSRDPDLERRAKVLGLVRFAGHRVLIDENIKRRAQAFLVGNLRDADAMHLAMAESLGCDVLLTTDDRFVRRASHLRPPSVVKVENPIKWFLENVEP